MKQLSQESSDSLKISETRHGLGKREVGYIIAVILKQQGVMK